MNKIVNKIYYQLRPLIPRRFQIFLRKNLVKIKRKQCADIWPILQGANGRPKEFKGWPQEKRFAFILTHDVDTEKGQNNCMDLMKLEEQLGFRSSFNFVPERYNVSQELRMHLLENNFEVGVHGLNHDGKLFQSKSIFEDRAKKINQYIDQWGAIGFRAPAMHHNLDWIHLLNIEYDASTFDTDPFEPQSDGCGKIYPYWVQNKTTGKGYVELPYTLPQDFTVLNLMEDFKLSIWRQKLDWLVEKGAMVLLNTHPDYMCFDSKRKRFDEYHAHLYVEILEYLKTRYGSQCWHVLPKEIARFWKEQYVER